jgi:NADH-quinone oxidoreductase subunit L
MQSLPPIAIVALLAPLFPALAFMLLGGAMLLARAPRERVVVRIVSGAFTLSVLSLLSVAVYFVTHDDRPIAIDLGAWFVAEDYHFAADVLIDRLSVPMMVLTAIICGVIGRFSATYLVGEPGHARFYLLLSLFATGMFLLVMAGSLDLLIAGWELVGLSSMLLIAFFHERNFPVRNALRAFVVYRACDIGLLAAAVVMHHDLGTSVFVEAFGLDRWPSSGMRLSTESATLLSLCLLWAAAGKSALFPLGSWLPRAMEGPTPSSAVFYGALSVHAGAYLMLRMSPLLEHSLVARGVIVTFGLLTAVHGRLVESVQTDVKSQLAYATSTQVGMIFVEIGAGFPRLALLHLVGHAVLRTLQMLRAPNTIQDMMKLSEAYAVLRSDGQREHTSALARYFYHLSIERFHLDTFWERTVALPLMALSRWLDAGEQRLIEKIGGSGAHFATPRFTSSAPEPRELAPDERVEQP